MAKNGQDVRDDLIPTPRSAREFGFDQVRNAIQGIQFGEVRVIIQNGVIVQIERVEKQRL